MFDRIRTCGDLLVPQTSAIVHSATNTILKSNSSIYRYEQIPLPVTSHIFLLLSPLLQYYYYVVIVELTFVWSVLLYGITAYLRSVYHNPPQRGLKRTRTAIGITAFPATPCGDSSFSCTAHINRNLFQLRWYWIRTNVSW